MTNITNYLQAREYLESLIKPIPFNSCPSFDPLERMRVLLRLLGNPERKFKSIQVSGTSGKGSTSYLISHILTTAGYKTGLTISPHLQSITERMQINGLQMGEEEFVRYTVLLKKIVTKMESLKYGAPTYFEVLLAIAFLYFAKQKVEIAVVEVGLEGKYDGTNTLSPLIFVLNSIALDHTEFLGETVEEITREALGALDDFKAKDKAPLVVSGVTQAQLQQIIAAKCQPRKLPLLQLGQDFAYDGLEANMLGISFDFKMGKTSYPKLQASLLGRHQAHNASLAIATVLKLSSFGFVINEAQIRIALESAFFPGRIEVFADHEYTIVLDGAHNPAKMQALVTSLNEIYPGEQFSVIFACKKDKDLSEMLQVVLPKISLLILSEFHATTDASLNAAMKIEDIEKQVRYINQTTQVRGSESIEEALTWAKKGQDKILFTGSLYFVGEVRDYFVREGLLSA